MINWNFDPVFYDFGLIQIRWYGLMFLLGFVVSYRIFKNICFVENKPVDNLDTLLTYVVLGTIVGARLGHCLFYEPQYFLINPLEIFAVWRGGLASHGGGIGVIIAIWLFSKKYRNFSFLWIVDRASPLVALSGSFIRLGNLFNSEIIGKPTKAPWAFVFEKVDLIPRHPTQLYESLSYIFVSLIGCSIYQKYKKNPPIGLIFGTTVVLIFTFRIIWEFLKENQENFESDMFLNMGQILSMPFILVGIIFIVISIKSNILIIKKLKKEK